MLWKDDMKCRSGVLYGTWYYFIQGLSVYSNDCTLYKKSEKNFLNEDVDAFCGETKQSHREH